MNPNLHKEPNPFSDSEKCFTPATDDGHHFTTPFRPYAWTTYSGSDLRNLVQRTYHHHLPAAVEPDSPTSICGPEDCAATDSHLYALRGPAAGFYQDYSSTTRQLYRMRSEEEQYLDVKQRSDIKSEKHILCSNLEPSGSYQCMKCCKVGLCGFFSFLLYQSTT